MTTNIKLSVAGHDEDAKKIFLNKFKRFLTLLPEYKFRIDGDDELTLFYTKTEGEFLPPEFLPPREDRGNRSTRYENRDRGNRNTNQRQHRARNLFGV